MVGKQNIACLTIETAVRFGALHILGFLSGEGKVDGDALPWYGSVAGGSVAAIAFGEFLGDAGRAEFEDAVSFAKLGDALDMFVCIVEVGITTVIQTLVPEKLFGVNM